MRKRDYEIKLRFSRQELEALDAKVASTTLSREAFVREVLAGRDIPLRMDVDAFALTMALREVGNKLNLILSPITEWTPEDPSQLQAVTDALWRCLLMVQDAYFDLGGNKGGCSYGRLAK